MGRAQRPRALTPLRKDSHNRTHVTYRSRQQAVNPTCSNNTGVFYLTIVRCTIHTPTVRCITLRCAQSTELPQHHKYYAYVLARQPHIDSSAIKAIQSDVLPQLSRYTRPLSRTRTIPLFFKFRFVWDMQCQTYMKRSQRPPCSPPPSGRSTSKGMRGRWLHD